ncbi:MAG: hypothetical protein AAFX54_07090 [Pseudomonadota bacterium]
MKLGPTVAFISITLIMTACASGRSGPREAGPAPGIQQPGRLLAMARDTQAKRGCKSAIPAYRVISSFGDGYDIAQYELGACLLENVSENPAETALFREEAALWLRRAAWAGNARAQLKLAEALSGAAGYGHALAPNPEEALAWSAVYRENAKRDLYDLPNIPERVSEHLNATLDNEAQQRASQFADDFAAIKMAAFTPPRAGNGEGRSEQQSQQPQGGQRRRRPR